MLRQSLLSCMNQSYKEFIYSVGIKVDKDTLTKDFTPLYEDLLDDERLVINVGNNHSYTYGFSHFNNMDTIKYIPDYESYDLFIKMDDDDIYKKNYVENIVKHFTENPDIDITSSKINYQLNGSNLYYSEGYDNLGGNPNNSTYHMPMTFAFNKKALDSIINLSLNDVCGHDDMMWRIAWEKAGLKHVALNNDKEIIWHIHGGNASVGGWLKS